jgi:hypothetical protein
LVVWEDAMVLGSPPDDYLDLVISFANQVALPLVPFQNLVFICIYAGINIGQDLEKNKR